MAESVRLQPHLILRTHIKQHGKTMCASSPSSKEAETGGSPGQTSHSDLLGEFQVNEGPCLN